MRVKLIIRWRTLVFAALGVLAFALRIYGLNWDQGNNFHPDERQILFHATTLSWPTSLAQFLNADASPLNPHFFAYGSFPLYLLAGIGNILLRFVHPSDTFVYLTLVGRVVTAIFDTGTVLLTGWLALLLVPDKTPGRPYAWNVALLATALVAFTPFQLQLSHFYAVDPMMLFFVMLTLVGCVLLVTTQRLMPCIIFVSIGYGLALATKFSAAPLAVPIIVALVLRWYQDRDRLLAFSSLVLIAIITLLVMLVAQPYTLLDLPNFIQQVADQGSLARGTLDLPYVRQFAGTIPFVYEVQNMVLWGMGVTLGISAFASLLWLCWRALRRQAGMWLVILSWVLVYTALTGSFYVKFMRYMLPVYPLLTLMAAAGVMALVHRQWKFDSNLLAWLPIPVGKGLAERAGEPQSPSASNNKWLPLLANIARYALVPLVLAGTIFQGLALLNVYSQPNTRVQASLWMYSHIAPGSVLTYEQWDDPLPVALPGHNPRQYPQFSYTDASGNPQTGLDLYGDDTPDKAQKLANILPQVNVLTMATDRLDKSIPRLPARYPLTIRYYQLLFSGQLGFHLVKEFQNRPTLLGITLDDSNADESYSVFDHPTVRIFVRDTPYPYTPDQLYQKLIQGVQLPPLGASLSGVQHTLLLSQQQIDDNQKTPPFSVQFPADSLANTLPLLFWWLALTVLGVIIYPLLFTLFRPLSDRGYIFSKVLGLLLLAYLSWLLASLHVLPFSHLSVTLVFGLLALCGATALWFQRSALGAFLRQRWRFLLLCELIFSAAFLLFVVIRSLNPDLWSIWRGGEKPMELAFLNAVLRSAYMPPPDPWFSGGYINYYYYGYVIFGALIKLTGIIPTVAFNLVIPTLFAMTFTGAVIIVHSFTRRISFALLGGYFTALIGNFDALGQVRGQLLALLSHTQIPAFDYWQSSRIIPFTINEFPFWSFLFSDVHPHVIDMPISVCMLGILATCLLSTGAQSVAPLADRVYRRERVLRYLLAAFVFGTITCVNTWDMPVYACLLAVVLVVQCVQELRGSPVSELFVALLYRVGTLLLIYGCGYLFYLPFYLSYQQLYVNGVGRVEDGSPRGAFLTIFGFWLFLALSFFLVKLYQQLGKMRGLIFSAFAPHAKLNVVNLGYILLSVLVVLVLLLLGLNALLAGLLLLGISVCAMSIRRAWIETNRQPSVQLAADQNASVLECDKSKIVNLESSSYNPALIYTYLLLFMGLCICLGIELVYIRDFLDGGDSERMNTVFKFSIQAWLSFGIAGALVVHRLWNVLKGWARRLWMVLLTALVIACSVFLVPGTVARIADHQFQATVQKPVLSPNYTPTLDGFNFVLAWYPGDAKAIAWLNAHVSGSPTILEAVQPASYTWVNRVSVYTGLPDVLGWADHVGEQRYGSQPLNRATDINMIYSTLDPNLALQLLHYYHVRYVYVGGLEYATYAQQSSACLDKFARMQGLHVVYRSEGVAIYEVE